MSELPKGWSHTTLNSVGSWGSGGTPKRTNKSYYDGNIPWLVIGDLNDGLVNQSKNTITDLGVQNSSAKLIDEGTLLIAMYGSIGKLGITGFKCATNQAIANCTVNEELVNKKYLFYYLKSRQEHLLSMGKGGAQQNISQTVLKAYDCPIAPLNEQIRIADKLDSMLAKVDAAQTRLDKIPNILKRFRQSVLAAATSGELTKEWRMKNKTLWKCDKYTVSEIANDEKYSLGIGPFGSNLKVDDYKDEGHPLVFVRDIRGRSFGGYNTKFVNSTKFEELKAHRVKPGNILITKMGDPPGDVAVYPNDRLEAVITSDCIKLDVNEDLVSKDYVFYYMQSESFQIQIKEITAGVAQQKVNLKNFKALNLLLPKKNEQIEIVRLVESLFAIADTSEKQFNDAKTRINRLTQSILAKAFRGELVPQDENDEPASELLAGIKEQAELLKPRKKAKT